MSWQEQVGEISLFPQAASEMEYDMWQGQPLWAYNLSSLQIPRLKSPCIWFNFYITHLIIFDKKLLTSLKSPLLQILIYKIPTAISSS